MEKFSEKIRNEMQQYVSVKDYKKDAIELKKSITKFKEDITDFRKSISRIDNDNMHTKRLISMKADDIEF